MIREKSLYVHRILNEFSDGLIKVFIPVIIYSKTESLGACLAFIIGYYLVQSLFNYVLYQPMTRRPVLFLWIRILPVLLTQFLLLSDYSSTWLVMGFILSYSFSNVFYWTPLNFLFSKVAKGQVGLKTGKFQAASIIGKLLAPLVAGYILTFLDIQVLVGLSVLVYMLSILMLFRPMSSRVEPGTEGTTIEGDPKHPENKRNTTLFLFLSSYAIIGIFDTAEIFWSLYIYEISINFLYVGVASTLIQFGIIASNLLSGKITDKKRWLMPTVVALFIFSVTWILRANIEEVLLIFLISAIAGLLKPLFTVPFFSNFISEANSSGNPQRWIALREIAIKTGGLALTGTVALFGNVVALPFYISAVSAIILVRQAKAINQKHLKNSTD